MNRKKYIIIIIAVADEITKAWKSTVSDFGDLYHGPEESIRIAREVTHRAYNIVASQACDRCVLSSYSTVCCCCRWSFCVFFLWFCLQTVQTSALCVFSLTLVRTFTYLHIRNSVGSNTVCAANTICIAFVKLSRVETVAYDRTTFQMNTFWSHSQYLKKKQFIHFVLIF